MKPGFLLYRAISIKSGLFFKTIAETNLKTNTKLKIYDSAQRKKVEFIPLNPPFVKMYCCGPTVYDFLHIGNFRGAVFYNFVRNWLEFSSYQSEVCL